MKRLGIDFTRRSRAPWAGRVLLAVAAALCVDAAVSYRNALASIKLSEAKLAQRGAPGAAAREPAAAEVAAARETLERLAMPWEKLFSALESAASEDVALLGIEPDPKAGTVLISGDSRNYLAALSYVLNLSKADGLSGVQLVRHQAKADDAQSPVSFAVTAIWNRAAP